MLLPELESIVLTTFPGCGTLTMAVTPANRNFPHALGQLKSATTETHGVTGGTRGTLNSNHKTVTHNGSPELVALSIIRMGWGHHFHTNLLPPQPTPPLPTTPTQSRAGILGPSRCLVRERRTNTKMKSGLKSRQQETQKRLRRHALVTTFQIQP